MDTFLRVSAVVRLMGLDRSTIDGLMAEDMLPAPGLLANRAVAWRRVDLELWSAVRPTVNTEPQRAVSRRSVGLSQTRLISWSTGLPGSLDPALPGLAFTQAEELVQAMDRSARRSMGQTALTSEQQAALLPLLPSVQGS
jgi:predicted DNA-binding transcriptional regulator AlpA